MKEFSDTVAVNLIGAYNMSHYAIPFMPPGKSSIVHMSSTRAHQSEPDTAGYSASKAGLCGLTHSQVCFCNRISTSRKVLHPIFALLRIPCNSCHPIFVRLSFFTFYMHLMCCESGPQSKLNHLTLFLKSLKLLCAVLIAGNYFIASLFTSRN